MKTKFLLFCCTLLLIACQTEKETVATPPNVIIVMTDDQGWGDLSLHGNDSMSTPNLDAFAKGGIQFDRFYVSPLCAPTRASLLTGRDHLRTGTSWVTHRKEVMRSEEVTIAEIFKDAGYTTGIFGKWHNGEQYPHNPNGQGFDEFYGFTAGHWNNYFDTGLEHNGKKIKSEGYIIDAFTNKAIDFIQDNKEEPFLCYLPYNTPHSPFQVPDKYFDKYKKMGLTDKNACVHGMVENIDDNFGRILKTLQDLDIEENTIVLFLTDNGPNGRRYNGDMRGWKGQLHEGGMRVPLFIQWKNHLPQGKMVKELAGHIDLLPTLMELCGIENDNHQPFDGKSLVALLKEEHVEWAERNFYFVQNNGTLDDYPASVRNNRYRLVKDRQQKIALYDMQEDPSETTDISAQYPAITTQLTQDLENWFKEVTKNGITPELIEVGHSASLKTHLPAPEAKLKGTIQFEGGFGWANDWIKNWTSESDTAVWTIKVVESGQYQLVTKYASAATGMSLNATIDNNSVVQKIMTAHNPPFYPIIYC